MSGTFSRIEALERRTHLTTTPITLASIPDLGNRVAVDAKGDVFGTTVSNITGNSGGTIFEIAAGSHIVNEIASFGRNTGKNPLGVNPRDILIDSAGNLFGTADSQTKFTTIYDTPSFSFPVPDTEIWELKVGSSHVQVLATTDTDATLSSVDNADDVFGNGFYSVFEPDNPYYYAFRCSANGTVNVLESGTSPGSNLPVGITADAAGDAFILSNGAASDIEGNVVQEVPAGQTAIASTFSPTVSGEQIRIDNSETFYLDDTLQVIKYAAGSQTTTAVSLPSNESRGYLDPFTADTAGNVFETASLNENEAVIELPAGSSTFQALASNFATGSIASLTSDNSGDVFATTSNTIFEVPGVATVTPIIASLSTSTAYAGKQLTLNVTGANTNFSQGQTTASLGAGVTIDSVNVIDATHLTITADVSSNAGTGDRGVVVTTGSQVAFDGNFVVVAPAAVALTGPAIITPLPSMPGVAVFTVSIPVAAASDVTVQYTTADGSAIAGMDYNAATGTATIPAGQTSTTIDVPVSAVTAGQADKTFSLVLSDPSDDAVIGDVTASATVSAVTFTTATVTSAKPVTYTSSTGAAVKLVLSGAGIATAYFANGATDPTGIQITGTNARSTFTLTTGRNKIADIGGFDVQSPLGSFSAPGAILTGNSVFRGNVSHITLGDNQVVGDLLQLNGTGDATIAGKSLDGLTIVSTQPIRTFTATSFASGSISAPSLTSLTVKDNLGANLNLSSGSSAIHVGGQITDGSWMLVGSLTSLKTTGTAAIWSANIAGNIGSIAAAFLAGSITTPGTIKSIGVSRNMTANISAGAINTIWVKGEIAASQIHSTSSINSITVGDIAASDIFAGLSTVPASAANFTNPAGWIASFISRDEDGFSGTVIAAANLGKVSIDGAATTGGGSVAAEHVSSFAFSEKGYKAVKFSNAKISAAVPVFAGTDFSLSIL